MFSDVHLKKEIRVVYLEEATCSQKHTIIVIRSFKILCHFWLAPIPWLNIPHNHSVLTIIDHFDCHTITTAQKNTLETINTSSNTCNIKVPIT